MELCRDIRKTGCLSQFRVEKQLLIYHSDPPHLLQGLFIFTPLPPPPSASPKKFPTSPRYNRPPTGNNWLNPYTICNQFLAWKYIGSGAEPNVVLV